jgi:threonine aldolase
MNVETNIVVGYLKENYQIEEFIDKLKNDGILAIPFGKGRVRMVTHLDVSIEDVEKVISSLKF